jgi:hypothetical protein
VTAAAPPETPDLVGSWAAYHRMTQAGISPASLDALIVGGARAPLELPVVDIKTLLYRGDRALRRAEELRAQAQQAASDSLRALVLEVCDLVALAREPTT